MLGSLEGEGLVPLPVATEGKAIGIIGVADTVREEMKRAIIGLKEAGVGRIAMLTGDSDEVARRVASSVGINCSWPSFSILSASPLPPR